MTQDKPIDKVKTLAEEQEKRDLESKVVAQLVRVNKDIRESNMHIKRIKDDIDEILRLRDELLEAYRDLDYGTLSRFLQL